MKRLGYPILVLGMSLAFSSPSRAILELEKGPVALEVDGTLQNHDMVIGWPKTDLADEHSAWLSFSNLRLMSHLSVASHLSIEVGYELSSQIGDTSSLSPGAIPTSALFVTAKGHAN